MKELQACVNSSSTGNGKSLSRKMKYYFTAREFITPLGIMLFLSIVQGSCGVDTISYYSLKIFRLARISLDEYVMAILLQVNFFNLKKKKSFFMCIFGKMALFYPGL